MVLRLFALRLPEEDPTQDVSSRAVIYTLVGVEYDVDEQELEGWLDHVDEDFRAKVKRFRLVRDSLSKDCSLLNIEARVVIDVR